MNLQEADLRAAFLGLGLFGDDHLGAMDQMGMGLLLAPAGLMTLANVGLLRILREDPDKRAEFERALCSSAQWAAYVTFLDVMSSAEWAALAAPSTRHVDDRLAALMMVIHCWGWGRMEAVTLDEGQQTLTFEVHHAQQAQAWRMHAGPALHPVCFLWAGIAGGLLDILLGQRYGDFEGREVQCAACRGGVACHFVAARRQMSV